MSSFLFIFVFAMTFVGINELLKGLLAHNDIISQDLVANSNTNHSPDTVKIKKERMFMVIEGAAISVVGILTALNPKNIMIGSALIILIVIVGPFTKNKSR